MSFARKLSRAFNRTVTHGAFIAASVIMSAGTGYEVSNYLDGVQNAVAPQANVEMHNAAADKVNKMVQDITTSQERIDFSWTALQAAKENIGKNGGKIAEQLADVNAGFTAYEASRAEQMERLKTLRRELLFNPALSEKEATTLYEALWEQSTTGDYRNFFSPSRMRWRTAMKPSPGCTPRKAPPKRPRRTPSALSPPPARPMMLPTPMNGKKALRAALAPLAACSPSPSSARAANAAKMQCRRPRWKITPTKSPSSSPPARAMAAIPPPPTTATSCRAA